MNLLGRWAVTTTLRIMTDLGILSWYVGFDLFGTHTVKLSLADGDMLTIMVWPDDLVVVRDSRIWQNDMRFGGRFVRRFYNYLERRYHGPS